MSGRLWTPLDQVRLPKWQVWLATKEYRPDPKDAAKPFDWEVLQLKTHFMEGEEQRAVSDVIDRHIRSIAAWRMIGMSTDEIAVAFGVTRQAIERRCKRINCARPPRRRPSEIPTILV
jgi:transposase